MRILIVDDSKPMRRLIQRTVIKAGFEGHEFIEACDGAEALDFIEGDCPDLVLADWNMPNMNGIELLEALNRKEIDVKYGFITSEQTAEMETLAKGKGALFLIGKPFDASIFQAKLTGIIQ